jgi:hypothetical protein
MVLETPFKFAPKLTTLIERKADDTLKGHCFDAELFALAVLLSETLDPEVSLGTELEPRPAHVKEGEDEIFVHVSEDNTLKAWLLKCKPVARVIGTEAMTFKETAMRELHLETGAFELAAKSAALDFRGQTNSAGTRVVLWRHPERNQSQLPGTAA